MPIDAQTAARTRTDCDLILKGGVTSGVVYPKAVSELAQSFRFRDIGGTSAGAIAATFAAAAEYRRQTSPDQADMSGFEMIEALSSELGDVGAFFQPDPKMHRLFRLFLRIIEGRGPAGKIAGALRGAAVGYWWAALAGLLIGLIAVIIGIGSGLGVIVIWGIFAGLVMAVVFCTAAVAWDFFHRLPQHDFGMCAGRTVPGAETGPGLTDWMADKIDLIAGNLGPDGKPGKPLTVGNLLDVGISVAAMTTDLSSRRPYELPLKDNLHCFRESDFQRLFPDRIVAHLKAARERPPTFAGEPADIYSLPGNRDFPVLLVARMSLSFPWLIRAVPLYRVDFQYRTKRDRIKRRCLFSDGGISSNFPVHMFDQLLPIRPTLGIALASWNEKKHGAERVKIYKSGRQSTDLGIEPVKGMGSFVFSIFSTAKDWQDTLTSRLRGFSERIVEIRLDDTGEGGLNLTMPPETIASLIDLGAQAGVKLRDEFDPEDHYRARAGVILPLLEAELGHFNEALAATPEGSSVPYAQIVRTCLSGKSGAFMNDAVLAFAQALAKVPSTDPEARPRLDSQQGWPNVDARVGLIANADRVPR